MCFGMLIANSQKLKAFLILKKRQSDTRSKDEKHCKMSRKVYKLYDMIYLLPSIND